VTMQGSSMAIAERKRKFGKMPAVYFGFFLYRILVYLFGVFRQDQHS
jgi:hypothetical protein